MMSGRMWVPVEDLFEHDMSWTTKQQPNTGRIIVLNVFRSCVNSRYNTVWKPKSQGTEAAARSDL